MSLLERLAQAARTTNPLIDGKDHLQIRMLTDDSGQRYGVQGGSDEMNAMAANAGAGEPWANRPVTREPVTREWMPGPPPLDTSWQPADDSAPIITEAPVAAEMPAPHMADELQQHSPERAPQSHDPEQLAPARETLFAIAGAIATLDAIESKLLQLRSELTRIQDSHGDLDTDKAVIALERLGQHINAAVFTLDMQCANLMRDVKLKIKVSDLDRAGQTTVGLELTIISVEKLLDCRLRDLAARGAGGPELIGFIDRMAPVVSSNINVLSSLLLTLCAARDYADTMINFLGSEGIISAPGVSADDPPMTQSTLDALRFGCSTSVEHNDRDKSEEIVQHMFQSIRQNRPDIISLIGNRQSGASTTNTINN